MSQFLDPFRFVLIALSGWMNSRQALLIDYLREENRVLREQLGEKRLRFTDDQRRRLATKAKGGGTEGAGRVGHDRHSRDAAGLAPPSDRAEVRRQHETGTWSTADGGGD